MKFNKQIILLLALAGSLDAFSYDFTKNGIYYDIVSEEKQTVEVASNGNNTYSGKVSIKGTVEYDGKSYAVVGVGKSAFSGSDRLSAVTLPSTLTYIADEAFYRCKSLAGVIIPEWVTSIGASAFDGCASIESITLPDKVSELGKNTFARCAALKSATLSPAIANVPEGAFYGCTALEDINIPEGVQTFGRQAFSYCEALAAITFPSTVTALGDHLFTSCKNLTTVSLSENLAELPSYCFAWCGSLKNIELPAGLTAISDHAFTDCEMLERISLPMGVKAIPDDVFGGCSSLSEVVMGEVESIGSMAFYECKSLTSIELPETLKSIGTLAFYDCRLTSLTLPSSLMEVGYSAFDKCYLIADITIDASSEKVVFGCNPSNAGQFVRFDTSYLERIELGRDISYYKDEISTNYSPFRDASGHLKEVVVGEDVTDAAVLCLNNKAALECVTFGSGLTYIPAMNKCEALKTIELKSSMPQMASEFTDAQYASVMLYVPQGTRQYYAKAPIWGKFANIVEKELSLAPSLGDNGVSVNAGNGALYVSGADGQPVAVYSATTGQNVYMTASYDGSSISLASGVYIVKVADRAVKVTL